MPKDQLIPLLSAISVWFIIFALKAEMGIQFLLYTLFASLTVGEVVDLLT